MAAAVENDIEDFIRNQKAKLQKERQYLSNQKPPVHDQTPRKPELDYNEMSKAFQEQRRKEYNEFINKPRLKKAPTPPQSGMKFGEFEDFRKRVEQRRKDEYREQLEKQTVEQAIVRSLGDVDISIPRKQNVISDEELQRRAIEKQRRDLQDKMVEDRRVREFERMLRFNRGDDFAQSDRNRELEEDLTLTDQDIEALLKREAEEREIKKKNEEREREIARKQSEIEKKLEENAFRDGGYYGFQEREKQRASRSVPSPAQQALQLPLRQHTDYEPPRQTYSPPQRQLEDDQEFTTDKLHLKYENERKQDYQDYLNQKNTKNKQAPEGTGAALPIGEHEKEKARLKAERQQEFKEFMDQYYITSQPRRRRARNLLPSLRNDVRSFQDPLVMYREQISELLKTLDKVQESNLPKFVLREYLRKLKLKKDLIEENYHLQVKVLRKQHAWPRT